MQWILKAAEGAGGYLGIFLVSIVGNLVPFIPIPYLAAVAFYSAVVPNASPLLVGIVSGVGAGIGKLAIYLVGRGARLLLDEKTAAKYERLGKLLRNYGALAVCLIAATPSPDDAIIIPLGLMKYDLLKFFIGVVTGKIFLSLIVAYGGHFIVSLAKEQLIAGIAVGVISFFVVMAVLFLVDWDWLLETLSDKGLKGLIQEIRERGVNVAIKGSKGGATA